MTDVATAANTGPAPGTELVRAGTTLEALRALGDRAGTRGERGG